MASAAERFTVPPDETPRHAPPTAARLAPASATASPTLVPSASDWRALRARVRRARSRAQYLCEIARAVDSPSPHEEAFWRAQSLRAEHAIVREELRAERERLAGVRVRWPGPATER